MVDPCYATVRAMRGQFEVDKLFPTKELAQAWAAAEGGVVYQLSPAVSRKRSRTWWAIAAGDRLLLFDNAAAAALTAAAAGGILVHGAITPAKPIYVSPPPRRNAPPLLFSQVWRSA